jgi:hypothetical protein
MRTHVEEIGTKSATFRHRLFSADDDEMVFTTLFKSVCLDLAARKAAPIPDDIRAGLVDHDGRRPRCVLRAKTAIVTGGGSGFGAGIARIFAREGAQVMVADINEGRQPAVADEIGGIAQAVDVSDGASVAAMTEAALTHGAGSTSSSTMRASPICPPRWRR